MHVAESYTQVKAERSNMAIARQDLRPSWLSKQGFLPFGSLRSYPLGQLRRLAQALKERSLPLGRPEVRTLVLQALYQLGSLRASAGTTELACRTGWLDDDDVAATLCAELGMMADELEHTPREHDTVLLLGEVAA
jgi:hypothetical protein